MQFVGFQFLHQGLNPGPQQWESEVLTTGLPEKSLEPFKVNAKKKKKKES